MLTNGELFRLYGVVGNLRKGALQTQVLYCLTRSQLGEPAWVSTLVELLAREPNEQGTIPQVITRRQEEMRRKREQLHEIETAIQALTVDRNRIDADIQHLESERTSISKELCLDPRGTTQCVTCHELRYPASAHILRLLGERGARSKSTAVQRQWLDEQLVGKVEGVPNPEAVSFALIELKKVGKID
jgi:hypothetical protein